MSFWQYCTIQSTKSFASSNCVKYAPGVTPSHFAGMFRNSVYTRGKSSSISS